MRVVGGEFKGRTLKVPKSDLIRPTQDRVREALFNIIAGEVRGSSFLDLFAGSGAVGIEALSRGASSVTFVESNRRHLAVLEENLSKVLGAVRPSAAVAAADVYRWMQRYSGDGFGVVFADPPYALGEQDGFGGFMETLGGRGIVRKGGIFVAEMKSSVSADGVSGWEIIRDRKYGKTRICIWRYEGKEAT